MKVTIFEFPLFRRKKSNAALQVVYYPRNNSICYIENLNFYKNVRNMVKLSVGFIHACTRGTALFVYKSPFKQSTGLV